MIERKNEGDTGRMTLREKMGEVDPIGWTGIANQ